jgi:starch-binding outer membrane protein, SusD/RagB family
MKYINIYRLLFTLVLLVSIIWACNKKLDTRNPNFLTPETYFKNADEISRGANAIYSVMRSNSLVSREWFFVHDLRGGEMKSGGSQLESPRAQILGGSAIDASNSVMGSVWNALYMMIHRANTVLANAPNGADNPGLRDRAVGEAKFLRAWAYYELASTWGDVPVYTTMVTSPDQFQPKSPAADVYAVAEQDLIDAATLLPPGFTGNDVGRATRGAANALLGKVYLQQGKYAEANTVLLAVRNSALYSLSAVPYENNFIEETEFNPESIFEVIFVSRTDNGFNWGGTGDDISQAHSTVRAQEYSPLQWRNLIPSSAYLREFEPGDPRYSRSVYSTGDAYSGGVLADTDQNGDTVMINGTPRKISWRKYTILYKNGTKTQLTPSGINHRIIRYADVLLMLAEAENERTGGSIATAVGYINEVRGRVGVAMTPVVAATKNAVRLAIMHERFVELGGEEVRDRDLVRWHKAGWLVTDPLPNHADFLPIPQSEVDNNPNL